MRKTLKILVPILVIGVLGVLYAGGSFDRHLVSLGLNATECWYGGGGEHVVKCGAEATALKELKKEADKEEAKQKAEEKTQEAKDRVDERVASTDYDDDGMTQDLDSNDFDASVQ